MLCVSHLQVCARKRPILNTISFSLESGETLAIMGPSGCGKTTLLKAIAGLVPFFTSGEVTYQGVLWQNQAQKRVCAQKRPAALLFQESAIWPHLAARKQINLVTPKALGRTQISTEEIISGLRLSHQADTLGRDLSGGEKQRVALGRVLKTTPRLLLLDEPFTSLDVDTKHDVISFIKDYRRHFKCGIIISTHNEDEARLLTDRVFKLS